MNEKTKQIYTWAFLAFGQSAQTLKAVEELNELATELARHLNGKQNLAAVVEEIADAEIMLEQLRIIFMCDGEVDAVKAEKIARLERRLREHDADENTHIKERWAK